MAKYLHKFESLADFNSAYNGSDYQEPWVSYTNEDGETPRVDYNKGPLIERIWELNGNTNPYPTKVLILPETNCINVYDHGQYVSTPVTCCGNNFRNGYRDLSNDAEATVVDAMKFKDSDIHPNSMFFFLWTDPETWGRDYGEGTLKYQEVAYAYVDQNGDISYNGFTTDLHVVKIGDTFYTYQLYCD
jgi:hypothetical protein